MLKLAEIRRVHIELTTRCNARCPMCMRNYRGYDYNSGYPDTELTVVDIRNILKPSILAQLELVSFNGNLGDFALSSYGLEIVEYITAHNVKVTINTNGSLRGPNWWKRLALPGVEIGFALDGLADTHALYRQDTQWNRIIENARAFIDAGGNAVWRFVPFEHNKHQEEECKRLAKEYGFSRFENIYDGRDRGPVFQRNGEFSHWLGPVGAPEKHLPEIQNLLEGHITWYKKTDRFKKDTPELNLQCIHKRNKEIYIAADGSVYPCCYLGFYPHSMQHPGNQELKELVSENNALKYDLEHCLEWFSKVEQTWDQPSIAQGRLYQCVNSCNRA